MDEEAGEGSEGIPRLIPRAFGSCLKEERRAEDISTGVITSVHPSILIQKGDPNLSILVLSLTQLC